MRCYWCSSSAAFETANGAAIYRLCGTASQTLDNVVSKSRLQLEFCSPRCCVTFQQSIWANGLFKEHSVWKSQKMYHLTLRAKRATFTFWADKSSLKMPKIVDFDDFWKIWSFCAQTFNGTKTNGKCRNKKLKRNILDDFQRMCCNISAKKKV